MTIGRFRNSRVARWLEPHVPPHEAEQEYWDFYGERSHQWGEDDSRVLKDWACYARLVLLDDTAHAAGLCPARPDAEAFPGELLRRIDATLAVAADPTDEQRYVWIMDPDVEPLTRLTMIVEAGAVLQARIDRIVSQDLAEATGQRRVRTTGPSTHGAGYAEAWELLHQAVMELATGNAAARKRLVEAYTMSILMIPESNTPPELALGLKTLSEEFERVVPIDRSGSAAATAETLSDDELWDLVRAILDLYVKAAPYANDE